MGDGDTFSSGEVLDRLGVTYRQLHYATGRMFPWKRPGSGRVLRYTEAEVAELQAHFDAMREIQALMASAGLRLVVA